MSEADFHALFRTSLLRDKLEKAMQSEVVTTTEQIRRPPHLDRPHGADGHGRFACGQAASNAEGGKGRGQGRAEAALKRVTTGGEDFAAVAAEVSNDPGSKDKGGDWIGIREATSSPSSRMSPGR